MSEGRPLSADQGTKPISPEMAEFGRRLKAIADARGLGEEDLAKMLDYSAYAIRALLKGQNTVAYIKLAELCHRLSVTPNDLLGFSPQTSPDREKANTQALAVTTKLIDVIAGILIGEGWDEASAEKTAELALRYAQEPTPEVREPRAWIRAVASERARRAREPR